MKVKAWAPGKVILLGEHFVVHGSRAALSAIDCHVKVTMSKLARKISIKSDIGSIIVNAGTPIDQILFELRPMYYIAETLLKRKKIGGIKMVIDSRIPYGVGLGSSSACCVAAAAAAVEFANEMTNRSSGNRVEGVIDDNIEEIIDTAIAAERIISPDTSGIDCMVSAYGGIGVYDGTFNKKDDIAYGRVIKEIEGIYNADGKPSTKIPKNDMRFVIADSGARHNTQEIVEQVARYKSQNPKKFEEMSRSIDEMVKEIPDILETSDHKRLGAYMNKNHQYLREIGVSNDRLDKMVKLGSTPYGAKVTGAGGGGCICAITDRATHKDVLSRYIEAGYNCSVVDIENDGVVAFI